METTTLELDRGEARRLFRKYREHRAHQLPIDAEIQRLYQLIAQGRVIIRALHSIGAAGLDPATNLPRLALVRADQPSCLLTMAVDGSAVMAGTARALGAWNRVAPNLRFDFPADTFPRRASRTPAWRHHQAMTPHIPPDIRPARGLANYCILYEAVWEPVPPVDPMLLRRVGVGDTWLVVGAWELTAVERAAMADRIGRT